MKFGKTSLLELICKPLFFLNVVKYHYSNGVDVNFRSSDLYEHVFTGFIATLIFCVLSIFSKWFLIGIVPVYIGHIIVKEVILDKSTRINSRSMITYKVDLITRNYGFLIGLPFVVAVFFR